MVARYYTPDLANRSLPLVGSITRDVCATAQELRRTWEQLDRVASDTERAELAARVQELDQRLRGLQDELDQLGVELKDPVQGLLDFRAQRRGRDVYLCWRLGEDRVDHWHEIQAGFGGRKPIATF